MAETVALPHPDITTRVELPPPQIESVNGYEKMTQHIDPSLYFSGISKEDREFTTEMLLIDTRIRIEKMPGLEGASSNIVGSLSGDLKDRDGIPYQSIQIAGQINSGSARLLEKSSKDDNGFETRIPITEEDFNELIRTAPNDGLATYARMLRDMHYPQDYSSKTILEPMPFDIDRNVAINHHGKVQFSKGVFCGEAEGRFMNSALKEGGLEEIILGGEVIALRKKYGEDTALLTKEAVLNGVLLPKGTIVTVDYTEDGVPMFAFARLSAFVVDSPQELEAMSPMISSNAYFRNNIEGYEAVRALLGQDTLISPADLEKSIQEIDLFLNDHPEAEEIARSLREKRQGIRTKQKAFDEETRIMYEKLFSTHTSNTTYMPEDSAEERVAKKAYGKIIDKEMQIILERIESDLNPTVAYKSTLDRLEKTFGQQKIVEVRRLLRDREIAERVLASTKSAGIEN